MAIDYPKDIVWKPLIDTTEAAEDTVLATGDQILEGYSAWTNDTLYEGNIPDYSRKNPEINRLYLIDTLNKASELPFEFSNGGICYDERTGEIHLFGGEQEPRAHYSYNPEAGTYTVYKDLPYDFIRGSALYFDCINLDIKIDGQQVEKTIHILGSAASDSASTQYYEWDCYNDNWIKGTNLPTGMKHNGACVYNNEIHYIYNLTHYVFNKNTKQWQTSFKPDVSFINGGIAVLNNEILLVGGDSTSKKVLAFNGTNWRVHSTLPFNYTNNYYCFVAYLTYEANEHGYLILLNNNKAYSYTNSEFDSNAGVWKDFVTLIKSDSKQVGICIKNDVFYVFGGNVNSNNIYIYHINIQDTNMLSTLKSKAMGVNINTNPDSAQTTKSVNFKDKDGTVLSTNSFTHNSKIIKPNMDSISICAADDNYIIYQNENSATFSLANDYTSSTQLTGTLTKAYSKSSSSSSKPSSPSSSTTYTSTKTTTFTINETLSAPATILYLYNTKQNKITKYGDVSNSFNHIPKLFYLNNNLYAVGGYNTSSQNMYKYNKDEGKWENPTLLPEPFNFTAVGENKSVIIYKNKLHYFYNIKNDFKHWVYIENTKQWELINDDFNIIKNAGDECPYVTIIDNEIIALNAYSSYISNSQKYYFYNYKYDVEKRIWSRDEKSYSLMQKNTPVLTSKTQVTKSPLHMTSICSFSSSSSGSKNGYVYGHETGIWRSITLTLPQYTTSSSNSYTLKYTIPIKQTNFVYNNYVYDSNASYSYRYTHYWDATQSLNGTITAALTVDTPTSKSTTMQHFCFDGAFGIIGYAGEIYKIYSTLSTKVTSVSNEDMVGSALGLTIPRGYYTNKALIDRKTPIVYNQTYKPENRDILLPDKSYYAGKNKISAANKLKTPKAIYYYEDIFNTAYIEGHSYDYSWGPGGGSGGGQSSVPGRQNLLSLGYGSTVNPLKWLAGGVGGFEMPFANGTLKGYLGSDNKTYYVQYVDRVLTSGDPVALFTIATAGNEYELDIYALNTTYDTFSVYAQYRWATSYQLDATYSWKYNDDLDNSYDWNQEVYYYKNQAALAGSNGSIAGQSALYLRGITYTHNATKPTVTLGGAVTIQEAWTDTWAINTASLTDTDKQASADVWNYVRNDNPIGVYYTTNNVNTDYAWIPLSGSDKCNIFGMLRGRSVEGLYQTISKTTKEKDDWGGTTTTRYWTWDIYPATQTIFYNTLTFYLQNITLGSSSWYSIACSPNTQYIQTVEATTDNFFNVYLKRFVRTVSNPKDEYGDVYTVYTEWVQNFNKTITSVDIPQSKPLFNVVDTTTIPSLISTHGVIGQILNNKILNSIYFEHKNNTCYFTLKPFIFNVAFKNYIECENIIGTIYNYDDLYAANIISNLAEKTFYGKEAIMIKNNILAIKTRAKKIALFQFLSEKSLYFIGEIDYISGQSNLNVDDYETYLNNYFNGTEVY